METTELTSTVPIPRRALEPLPDLESVEEENVRLRARVRELEHTFLAAPARTLPCPKCESGFAHA